MVNKQTPRSIELNFLRVKGLEKRVLLCYIKHCKKSTLNRQPNWDLLEVRQDGGATKQSRKANGSGFHRRRKSTAGRRGGSRGHRRCGGCRRHARGKRDPGRAAGAGERWTLGGSSRVWRSGAVQGIQDAGEIDVSDVAFQRCGKRHIKRAQLNARQNVRYSLVNNMNYAVVDEHICLDDLGTVDEHLSIDDAQV